MKAAIWTLSALALVATPPGSPRLVGTSQEPSGVHGPLIIWDSAVAVRCPLTVGGSFEAKTGALGGDIVLDPQKQGELDGSLAVDLRTLQTGISLRDTHMRENYLEVQKGAGYEQATLSRIRLEGVNSSAPIGKVGFKGVLAVHGQEREVTGTADIRRAGEGLRVHATFPVKVSDFDIASPTYLGVGVRNEVSVAVTFQAISKRQS
jgi:polyisoprenoid-binding protein YceI